MTTRIFALASVAAAALGACDSYDPALSDQPFRCGTAAPLCPDGYTCVVYNPSTRVCERHLDTPDGGVPDATVAACVDRLEPNDVRTIATITPVTEQAATFDAAGLATCAGDVDLFSFAIDSTEKRLRIAVTTSGPTLALDVLNESNTVVGSGRGIGGGVVELRRPSDQITAPLAPGRYTLRIASPSNAEVAYSLAIKTCAGGPACVDQP